jgi:hypothetical protein
MSLANFISGIKTSSGSLIVDLKKRKLSAMSSILAVMIASQMTGFVMRLNVLDHSSSNKCLPRWSGLLIPLPIEIETTLTGHELDLSSSNLQ